MHSIEVLQYYCTSANKSSWLVDVIPPTLELRITSRSSHGLSNPVITPVTLDSGRRVSLPSSSFFFFSASSQAGQWCVVSAWRVRLVCPPPQSQAHSLPENSSVRLNMTKDGPTDIMGAYSEKIHRCIDSRSAYGGVVGVAVDKVQDRNIPRA